MTVIHIRCERRGAASAQFKVQPEIANDFLRKQTDQIRIPRQAGIVVREYFLRRGRSADVIILFQQQHTQTRAPEITGSHEPIVSGAENHDIVFTPVHTLAVSD